LGADGPELLVKKRNGRRVDSEIKSRAFRYGIAVAIALYVAAPASSAFADDGAQQINLGTQTFYVPKSWMLGMRNTPPKGGIVSAYRPPNLTIDKAQLAPINATEIAIQPGEHWQKPYDLDELPQFIIINYVQRDRPPSSDEQTKHWINQANSQKADADGFVRVTPIAFASDHPPALEAFLYKGYLNKFGEPLVIHSNNIDAPGGQRYLSSVYGISLQTDMWVRYDFDNSKFPKNTWWDLYQRVLGLINFLQTPR
jgi:hypothetical protein